MGHTSELSNFSRLLDIYPAAFDGNRLNLLFLENAAIIQNGQAYLQQLSSLSLMDERREYLIDSRCPWPFPCARLDGRPDPWELSQVLFSRFGEAQTIVPTQNDIAEMIEQRVRQSRPRVVALLIADGLSYYDLPCDIAAEPILVAGLTTTDFGYREVVGSPSISRRMFALGYAHQLGFTYFDQNVNDLARDIYGSFAPSQITRVKAFSEVLARLDNHTDAKTFVQVTLAGLDQLCHSHWDRPPREQYTQRILDNLRLITRTLGRRFGTALTILTADHGILWREHLEDRMELATDLLLENTTAPRYVKGAHLRTYGHVCRSQGQNYTLLRAPYMTRRFRNNEWGVHGGISAWESVVPLVMSEESG